MSFTKAAEAAPKLWHVVDARDQIVGRLAPQVARLLMGKHKPTFVPHVDGGDWVVIVNAKDAVLTGTKMRDKLYKWHTGWMGGLKTLTARQMHERAPERLLEHAIKGMMPPNRLRDQRMKRLRIFAGDSHPHVRQTAESQAYAPAYLTQYQPRKFSPPPVEETGAMAKNYFGNEPVDPKEMAARAKTLKEVSPEANLRRLEERLAREKAERAAATQLR